jgi:lipoyl(octanoyl) transferase
MVDSRYSKTMKWRYIPPEISSAALNMAKDEALLEAVSEGLSLPVLRFYGWQPPGLSLGYFQRTAQAANLDACKALQVDIVRRPTGGRAILHEHEVTYCVVMPFASGAEGSVLNTYKKINYALMRGLISLGVKARLIPKSPKTAPAAAKSFACFSSPSWYEVQTGGKKILGSAQCRRKHTLLQHGSLLLKLERDKLFTCLNTSPGERLSLQTAFASMTALEEIITPTPSFDTVARALQTGFFEIMGEYRIENFSADELDRIKDLAHNKYSNPEWNMMR